MKSQARLQISRFFNCIKEFFPFVVSKKNRVHTYRIVFESFSPVHAYSFQFTRTGLEYIWNSPSQIIASEYSRLSSHFVARNVSRVDQSALVDQIPNKCTSTEWNFWGRIVACIASVSVRFTSKERGTRVKDRAKSGARKRSGRRWGGKETFLPPSPPPFFNFWLWFHFSRGQNRSLSLLRNQTETLATQASRIADISCGEEHGDTAVLAAYTNQCLLGHVASPGNLMLVLRSQEPIFKISVFIHPQLRENNV